MQLPVDDITALIPQKFPFVMVGSLLEVTRQVIKSSLVIKSDNVLVKNGFFQEAGLMENIAQTAALRAGYLAVTQNEPVTNGYIGSVKNFNVLRLPAVGSQIITEVTIDSRLAGMTLLTGKVWLESNVIASCEMRVLEGN